jgi:hypothetical protein
MWRTYFTGVHDDGEEVVGEKHLSVPLGYQKGASIRGLIGWVERGGMVAPGVLFSQRAPLRLWSDLADTKRNADLVSEGGRDVGLASNEVLPLIVYLVPGALAECLVAHRAHADNIDLLAVAVGVVLRLVYEVSLCLTFNSYIEVTYHASGSSCRPCSNVCACCRRCGGSLRQ